MVSETQPAQEVPEKYDRLVWIDLEMTGLDPSNHVIVEIGALITDAHLEVLGEGIDIVVHASDDELAKMDDVVSEMHGSSGLTEQIRRSTITLEQAEDAVLAYISEHCDSHCLPPLAGNSIATDRSFIRAHMPRVNDALHYRLVDVSSVKELAHRWYPKLYYSQPEKGLAHRALADIIESIRELDYYRRCFFRSPGEDSADACAAAAQQSIERYSAILERAMG